MPFTKGGTTRCKRQNFSEFDVPSTYLPRTFRVPSTGLSPALVCALTQDQALPERAGDAGYPAPFAVYRKVDRAAQNPLEIILSLSKDDFELVAEPTSGLNAIALGALL